MEDVKAHVGTELESGRYRLLWPLDDRHGLAPSNRRALTVSERQLLLALVDASLIVAATGVLRWLDIGPRTFPAVGLALAAAWLAVGFFAGIYDVMSTMASRRTGLLAVLQTGIVIAFVLLVAFFIWPTEHRESVPALALASTAAVAVWRLIYFQVAGYSPFQRRVLVVGTGVAATALIEVVQRRKGHGVQIVGLVDDEPGLHGTELMGISILGGFSALWPLVVSEEIEEVVICTDHRTEEALLEGLGLCYERGIPVSLMPHLYEEVAGQVPVEHLGHDWLAAFPLHRKGGTLYRVIKRLVDFLASGLAIVVTSPLMAIAAALVRLSSPGPIFFRQPRAGLHGRPFDVVKFRTMLDGSGKVGTKLGDMSDRDRITSIGKWLRRLYIDELPQLFLILRGDMSLVGPRPKRADQARDLERTVPLWRAKYSVKPGLTGWGQLQYGYAKSSTEEMARLRYDLYYIKHCSLWLDFFILVKTALRVARLKGF
jgi:exopolysaccharide biosynthesis polyprenyl glycosylphosphotransferase